MLTSLHIQNIVLIENLMIDFQAGLCTLTGETGAGKSILLDSLGLVLGARADTGLIRHGTDEAKITAVFEIADKHPVTALLEESGLTKHDGEPLILKRILSKDGRSRGFINDEPVSIGLLKQAGERLVEIHGQFATQGLLDVSRHKEFLDRFAGILPTLKDHWDTWKSLQDELENARATASRAMEEESFLRQSIEDLDALSPESGEEEKLAAQKTRLQNRESILLGLNESYAVLTEQHDPIGKALKALTPLMIKMGDEIDSVVAPLERAAAEMQEAVAQIQSLSADLDEGENNLESIDERLYALRQQARKHQCTVDDLPDIREKLARALNQIENMDAHLDTLTKQTEVARKTYLQEAERISEKRTATAKKLDKAIIGELAPLKLGKATFVTDVSALPEARWGPAGIDQVRFLVSTAPGTPPDRLDKIASGGELSRFMLALKVVLTSPQAGQSGHETMIFDEVDAGLGGATAHAVGERLGLLAEDRQVLVITHSPQVAARANTHYIVEKSGKKTLTTSVHLLESNTERREEIARMLSGASITDEAKAAAEKLLQNAA